MHLVLTDVLTCPRCGSGLIVMADQMAGRQIMEGQLGCPGCRTNYPVRAGAADLRTANGAIEAAAYTGDASRLLALTGVTEARGFMLLTGSVASAAHQVVGIVPNLQLVAVNPGAGEPHEGVSVLLVDGALPFSAGSMRAVIATGELNAERVAECARVIAVGARVVFESDAVDRGVVEQAGLRVLAAEGNTVVALRAS